MLMETVRSTLLRDIGGLIHQIGAYPEDALVWKTVPGIRNSAGTLALHLAGNLEHYIGAVRGATGYKRDRDADFTAAAPPGRR